MDYILLLLLPQQDSHMLRNIMGQTLSSLACRQPRLIVLFRVIPVKKLFIADLCSGNQVSQGTNDD